MSIGVDRHATWLATSETRQPTERHLASQRAIRLSIGPT
jgi:hypothetical protein